MCNSVTTLCNSTATLCNSVATPLQLRATHFATPCGVFSWLRVEGKTPEEIRKTFNIKNDFTAAEKEQIRKENEWCKEK